MSDTNPLLQHPFFSEPILRQAPQDGGRPLADLISESQVDPPPSPTGREMAADVFRPLTPKRMGEYLTQKTLPQFDEGQRRLEQERAAKLPAAQWETKNLSPTMRKALAAAGSAAQGMTADTFAYIPGVLAKGLGKAGVSGYESYADMPVVEAKKALERKIAAASALEPGYGLAGQAGGLALGAATLPALLPSKGAAVSGAATGTLYGGLSGGAQEGEVRDALTGALVGALGGAVLGPVIERTASGLTRLYTGGRPVVDASGSLTPEAYKLARQSGLTDEQVNLLTPQLRQTFESRGLTPAAAKEARFAEFGIEPKRGMVSDDPQQLAREARFGDYGKLADESAEAAKTMVGGGQVPLRTAVEDAISAGQKNAQSLKNAVSDAYAKAESVPGSFSRESLTNVGDRLLGLLARDEKALAFRNSELVQGAAQKLNSDLGSFLPTGDPAAPRIMWRNFRAVEEARKGLGQNLEAARNNTDRAGMRRLIHEFEDYIENSINSGAFSGDRSVSSQWALGRKMFSDYQNKFGVKKTGEEAGTLMRSVLDGTKTADQVGNMMFNFASSGDATAKREALKVFFQLQRALGRGSPELETIKRSYVQQMMTPTKKGENFTAKDFADTAKQIDSFLKGSASDFARRTLTKEDMSMLARYADVMRMAGKSPQSITPEALGPLAQAISVVAPVTAAAASYSLGAIHPILATMLGAAAAVPARVGAIRGSEYMAKRAANLPPRSEGRPYQFPSVRTGIPLTAAAVPELEEGVSAVSKDLGDAFQRARPVTITPDRPQRATGGRTGGMTADMLIAAAERAKKTIGKDTEALLSTPDASVARALALANQKLEG